MIEQSLMCLREMKPGAPVRRRVILPAGVNQEQTIYD